MQYDEYGEPVGNDVYNNYYYPYPQSSSWSSNDYEPHYHNYPPNPPPPHYQWAPEGNEYQENIEEAEIQQEEPQYVSSNATEEGMLDEEDHLQVTDMFGVQERFVDAQITGTLEQFQNQRHLLKWKPTDQNLVNMGINGRMIDRENATEKDFTGDLSKAIILNAEVIHTMNDSPKTVAIKVKGIEPRVITKNDRFVWSINANSNHTNVNQNVTSPSNVFTRRMYEKQEMCDIDSLDKQIQYDKKERPNHALVDTRGFAWDIIMRNAATNPKWQQFTDMLYTIEGKRKRGELHNPLVELPKRVADDVYTAIKAQLEPIEKSFFDFNKFIITFHTRDNSAWNDPSTLVGQEVVFDEKTRNKLRGETLNRPYTIGVLLKLQYIIKDSKKK